MRIKKLEIVGFKSFCDRTVLSFQDPITGVVGPNGCGKSNVVDAIRWCMGEQSAKHLRGKAMEDVIFAGSDRRGPLGYCEVSLTFENDGKVPVEFMPYPEITIGRRLFRDGTSEYYMNKTPCRLKDITEFFMGTGIGTRAYSIIEQGRVGLIVTSKPEERRFLIEEAAGITKYKVKRKAAEKKMELTQQNLLRVSDVVAEQEKQLASLRRQAEKAERYKRYRAELRDIELWGYSQRWLGLIRQTQVLAEALEKATLERETAQGDLAAHEGKLAAERLSLAEEERRLQELSGEVHALGAQIQLGEAQNQHDKKERERLLLQIDQLTRELHLLSDKDQAAAREHERLSAELADLESGGAGQKEAIEAKEEAHKEAKLKLSSVQKAGDVAKAEISKCQAEIARHEADERSFVRQRDDLVTRLHRADEEKKRLAGRKGELEDAVFDQEAKLSGLQAEKVNLVKNRAQAEERLKDLKLQVTRLDKEVDQLRAELHKKRGRLHSLTEIAARYEGFGSGTRALLKKQDKGGAPFQGVVADILLAPSELELALDVVLGDRLSALLCESQDLAITSIDFLRASGEGRASFVPLSARGTRPGDRPQMPDDMEPGSGGIRGRLLDLVKARPGFEQVLDALLGNVLLCETVADALRYYEAASEDGSLSPAGLVVTLDGVLCDGHGILTGGSAKGQGASLLSQKRELRELAAQVAEMEERYKAREEELAVARAEQQHLAKQMDELQKAGHQGEMQILSLDKDLTRSREELHRTLHRLEVLNNEASDLGEQQTELDREAEMARMAIRDIRQRMVRHEGERDRQSREQLALLELVETLAHEVTQLKVAVAAYREKLGALRGALERLSRDAADRQAASERMSQQKEQCEKRVEELVTQVAEREQLLLTQAEVANQRTEELTVLRNAYEDRRGGMQRGEEALREHRGREGRLFKEMSRLEVKLTDLRTQRVHVEEAVMERHRVVVSEVVGEYHMRPLVTDKDDKRAAELRDLIDRMGEINLMAIEECRELEKRYTFLVAQKDDLDAALKQLLQAIVFINQTCKRRFREVFDLVNSKFQEIFPRCFTGGQARLLLTNEEDLLESGIEIVAQPPGKKNQTVELLSGGEKAMTAVALIFAIFLIKPSPFCLLDEVDAPLDEANVGRFNDLIREMTDRSQFIVITHNKRTMQIADTLYGVTMEEPGVSKVVSVNLAA